VRAALVRMADRPPASLPEQHNAHCLAWDYARALQIAPYGDEGTVDRLTREIVRQGFFILQSHKLAATDQEHVATLLGYFDPPQGATVLDAGCGVGAVAALMAAIRPDLQFSLLNISAAQLALVPPGMTKIHGDFHHLPIDSGTFDAVMFNFTLGHGLLDACIAEAARVLRPGGVLFIYDLTTDAPDYVIDRLGYRPHGRGEVLVAGRRHGLVATAVIENPRSTTADFTNLCGPAAITTHGLERTWPVIYRFELACSPISVALHIPQPTKGNSHLEKPKNPSHPPITPPPAPLPVTPVPAPKPADGFVRPEGLGPGAFFR
jgi:SAM-dependent methyltransferase